MSITPEGKKARKASVRESQGAEYDLLLPEFQKQARELLNAKGNISKKCECGRWVQVPTPEVRGWLELWKWYHVTTTGVPTKEAEPPRPVDTSQPIDGMTDDELMALLRSAGE